MVDVVAKERGFFGGIVREEGDEFPIPDSLWKDKKRRPKWVEPAKKATALKASEGKENKAGKGKETEAGRNHPEPQTIAEAQKEIGGGKPDWRPPGAPEGDPI